MTAAAAGGYPGKVGVRHPVDLPEGCHTTTWGRAVDVGWWLSRGLPLGRRAVGLQSTGCRTSPSIKINDGRQASDETSRALAHRRTGRHGAARQPAQIVTRVRAEEAAALLVGSL
jgi:hypothetical protein